MLKNKIALQFRHITLYMSKVSNDKYISKNNVKYYNSAISLSIFYKLSSKEQNYINKLIFFFSN